MIICYVASPYTKGDIQMNLVKHKLAGNELINLGYLPILPLLYHYQDELFPQPYEKWMDICLTLLQRADCLLRLDGDSNGADREVELAKECLMPVFYSINELEEYWNE